MRGPVRVLVVDDSHFVRRALARLLSSDPRVAVAGEAADGAAALDGLLALEPDVVTLDVEMPGQDGLSTLSAIMRHRPTPVIMVSARTAAGAQVSLKALAHGAVDVVAKPDGSVSMDLGALRDELIAKVLAAAASTRRSAGLALPGPRAGVRGPLAGRPRPAPPGPARMEAGRLCRGGGGPGVSGGPAQPDPRLRRPPLMAVALGASTGGVMALQAVLARVPAPLEVPIFVAQHMPAHFTAPLAELLEDSTGLSVREARDGEPVMPGWVYVAPGGHHLTVVAPGPGRGPVRLSVSDEPAAITLRPSVNRLFESVARVYGAGAMAVVLTGMGNDGTDGLAAVKAAGGLTLCQDESTSVVYGMPGSAVRAGLVDVVAPVGRLGDEIGRALAAGAPRGSA